MTVSPAPPILRRRHGSAVMRLLDLGTVPWIRSQSVHHAVAARLDADSPDTVVLVRPDSPYLSVGQHRLGPQPSPAAARRMGLPVVRRRLGGGTVLITPAQTFCVLVVHRRRLPLPDPGALRWCLGPVVGAYARLGIAATAGPGTDVTGAGRKLCGSGSASVGEASVFGGNVLADFDPEPFLAAVRLPSAAARRVLGEELRAQMGSVRELTGAAPSPEAVTAALREAVEEACETELVPGSLTAAEEAAIPEVERWLRRVPAAPAAAVGVGEGKGVGVGAERRVECWKVRAGCGLVRVALAAPRRTVVLLTVREGAVVAVGAERPEGRGLAAGLDAALRGHRLGAPVAAGGLGAAPAEAIGAALAQARRLLG